MEKKEYSFLFYVLFDTPLDCRKKNIASLVKQIELIKRERVLKDINKSPKKKLNTKIHKFDFEKFKKYINGYDPKKECSNDPNIVFDDMIHALGLSVSSKKYDHYCGWMDWHKFLCHKLMHGGFWRQ